MHVWYVFSRFPAETFAGSDVRVLRSLGVRVEAVNLRFIPPGAGRLLAEWGIGDVPLDEVTWAKLARGCGEMLRRPGLLAWGLAIVLCDCWRRPVQLFKSLLALPRCFQLVGRLDADSPDVVHLFWGHYASLFGLLVRRLHPSRVVTMFLGAYDLRTAYPPSVRLAAAAHRVFTHARANLPLLAAMGVPSGWVEVVYRGVDFERLGGGTERIPFRIATVGRLIPEKGMADVIESFAQVSTRLPGASLCVVGGGPQRRALELHVGALGLNRVEFTGSLAHREVLARLGEAEVFLSLSHEEHIPNVVKEAIAAGCACVVSRTAGIEELVQDGVHGFVVEVGDVAAAAAAVERLFADAGLRQRLAAAALGHLRARFDAQVNMRRYVEVWGEALPRGKGGALVHQRGC